MQVALHPGRQKARIGDRLRARLAVGVARLAVDRLRPAAWRRLLGRLQGWARRPATPAEAADAWDLVTGVSLRCAGPACLERSVAVAVLCASRRTSVRLCVGVRSPPFTSHAWVEAAGQPVRESADVNRVYTRILSI